MSKDNIKDNLYALYEVYSQYKLLYAFYQENKNIKNAEEVKERIEYLRKNPKCKQKTEIECLLWFLNEV